MLLVSQAWWRFNLSFSRKYSPSSTIVESSLSNKKFSMNMQNKSIIFMPCNQWYVISRSCCCKLRSDATIVYIRLMYHEIISIHESLFDFTSGTFISNYHLLLSKFCVTTVFLKACIVLSLCQCILFQTIIMDWLLIITQ